MSTEIFPKDADAFMFNSISRKDPISFVNYPDTIALINSTGCMTTTPPDNTALEENFKFTYSLDDSFKKSIKRDTSLSLLLKKENIWMLGTGTPTSLLENSTQPKF